MTVTCTFSELSDKLKSLTTPGTYRVVITDPVSVSIGNSNSDTTLGGMIKSCAEDHLKNGVYLDLSSSDLSRAQVSASYANAFAGCTQLTDIDDLPKTESSNFKNMFNGCSSLRTASVSNLAVSEGDTFEGMFTGCKSLVVLTVDKAFITATENEENLLADCTALKQIVVSDAKHPAVINKDTIVKGDIAADGDAVITGKSTVKTDSIIAGTVYGTGALKRDESGKLIQEGTDYSVLSKSEVDESIDSFVGNATSASKLNHTVNLRLNGEITGYVEMKTYEKDGKTVVVNTLKTEVNSLNSTDNDNNVYKIVTKEYLNQQLAKLKTSTMLKVDEIKEKSYVLENKELEPQEGVIYLVPSNKAFSSYNSTDGYKTDGYKTDNYNAYEEYIWEAKYETTSSVKTSTGILESVKVQTEKKNTLLRTSKEYTDEDETISIDGIPVTVTLSEIADAGGTLAKTVSGSSQEYTITSNNTGKIIGATVTNGKIKSVVEADTVYTFTTDAEAKKVNVVKEQYELADSSVSASDGTEVTYSITKEVAELTATGEFAWEHIGNTAMNLTDYLTNTVLKRGFAFDGEVITHNDLTAEGTVKLGGTDGLFTIDPTITGGIITADAPVTFTKSLNVTGATTLGSTLDVTGKVTAKDNLSVEGNTDIDGTLNVDGATTLKNSLTVELGTGLKSTLDVSGATTLNKTLEVKEDATLDDDLTVKGITNLQKDLIVGTYTSEEVDGATVVTPAYDAKMIGKLDHKITITQTKSGKTTEKVFDNTEDIDIAIQQSTLSTVPVDNIAEVAYADYDGSNDVEHKAFVPNQNVNTTSDVQFKKVVVESSSANEEDPVISTVIENGIISVSSSETYRPVPGEVYGTDITNEEILTPVVESNEVKLLYNGGTDTVSLEVTNTGDMNVITSNVDATLRVNGKPVAFGSQVDTLIARLAALEAKVEAFYSSDNSADSELSTSLLNKWGVTGNVNTSSK